MIRPLLGFCCCLAFLGSEAIAYAGDPSDGDMAERYSRSATAGDDRSNFILGHYILLASDCGNLTNKRSTGFPVPHSRDIRRRCLSLVVC